MYGVYADGAVYGAHVAVLDNWKQVSSSEAASKEGAPPIFKRAMFLGPAGVEGMVEIVRDEGALREVVPLSALRRTRKPNDANGIGEGASVFALCGEWLPAIVAEVSDDDCGNAAARITANVQTAPGVTTRSSLSRRRCCGSAPSLASCCTTRRGSPSRCRPSSAATSSSTPPSATLRATAAG